MTSARPLTELAAGEVAEIAGVTGGRALVGRLAALGFTPGAAVTPVRSGGPGPLIVLVRDTRVALGRLEAANVWVTPAAGTHDR